MLEALSAVDGVVEIMMQRIRLGQRNRGKIEKEARQYIGNMGISPKKFDVEKIVIQ